MLFKSITLKLLVLIVGAYAITLVSILAFSDKQLTSIIDESQSKIYSDKLNIIWHTLQRTEERLQKTGLVEAYSEDFKLGIIKELKNSYYQNPTLTNYPFIIDSSLTVIMHPTLAVGTNLSEKVKDEQILLTSPKGEFYSEYLGEEKWYVFTHFKEWNWTVVYAIPVVQKYRDVYNYRNRLIIILLLITSVVLVGLTVVLVRTVRPIVQLTDVSTKIAGGNLDQPIVLGGADEIGILSQSFENMRCAIKQKIEDLNLEITERLHAEQDLKKARGLISNIIDSMPSILVGVDLNGNVTQWNKKAETAVGISSKQAVGKKFEDVFPRFANEMNRIEKAIEARKEQASLKRAFTINGVEYFEDITIYPLIANGVQGAVLRIDDVTHKVKIEEALIQSEKMLSIGGLAAGMAHEINNPLGGMIQSALVMKSRLKLNAGIPANESAAKEAGTTVEAIHTFMEIRQIPDMITTIIEAGKRASAIVNNMLSFARKPEGVKSSYLITDLLNKAIEIAATGYDVNTSYNFKAVTIIKDFDEKTIALVCDPGKIQQVFLNILLNGAQAMFSAGTIDPQFKISTHFDAAHKAVLIKISDNGPGMEEEVRKRIFEPFFTTKPVGSGTGLGLSISYFIVTEHHDGQMTVDSKPGEGTSFSITLPLG